MKFARRTVQTASLFVSSEAQHLPMSPASRFKGAGWEGERGMGAGRRGEGRKPRQRGDNGKAKSHKY